MTGIELTGLEGRVALVTGAGRMRSIGRPIAVELARAGCDVVVTGTGRPPETYPGDEKAAGWRDIESIADEIRKLGRRATCTVSDVSSIGGKMLPPGNAASVATRVPGSRGRSTASTVARSRAAEPRAPRVEQR